LVGCKKWSRARQIAIDDTGRQRRFHDHPAIAPDEQKAAAAAQLEVAIETVEVFPVDAKVDDHFQGAVRAVHPARHWDNPLAAQA